MTVVNCLKIIGGNPITYENSFPLRKRVFISDKQFRFIQDIVISTDTANNGIGMEVVV